MNKLSYIPGDLVMTNGAPLGTEQDVVYRVTSSDPSKTLKLNDGTVMKGVVRLENLEGVEFGDKGYLFGDCCAWVKDIVPIPITPEILEKNGWEHKDYIYFKEFLHRKLVIMDENAYIINECCSMFLCPAKFVSQLQHLLFGLGLNSEMEV
jgi:hypothetical protein